jgi:hypothetical protein
MFVGGIFSWMQLWLNLFISAGMRTVSSTAKINHFYHFLTFLSSLKMFSMERLNDANHSPLSHLEFLSKIFV